MQISIIVSSILTIISLLATEALAQDLTACSSCDKLVEGSLEEWQCFNQQINDYLEDSKISNPTIVIMDKTCDNETDGDPNSSKNFGLPDVIAPNEGYVSETARAYLLSHDQISCLAASLPALLSTNSKKVSFDFSSCKGFKHGN